MKKCTRCKEVKADSEFYPHTRWCKPCKAAYAKQYHQEQHTNGPYGLMVLEQFIHKIYGNQIATVDDPKLARPYVTYYNANLTRRRLMKLGLDVKIVPLKA